MRKHFCERTRTLRLKSPGGKGTALGSGKRCYGGKVGFLRVYTPQPFLHEGLPCRCAPVLLQVGMTFLPLPLPQMMTETAFQRFQLGSVQHAKTHSQKGTAIPRKCLQCNGLLAAAKRRGQYAEGMVGREFQHHARRISGGHRTPCLFNGPPAGALAVSSADVALAGGGWWVTFRKSLNRVFSFHGKIPHIVPASPAGARRRKNGACGSYRRRRHAYRPDHIAP